MLRDELAADQSFRIRLAREARAKAEVDHPNLARVLEAGEADGRLYLAVRHVDGRSLAERLAAGGPLEVPDLVRLAGDAGAGLDALHGRGSPTATSSRPTSSSPPTGRPWSATSAWPRTAPGRC